MKKDDKLLVLLENSLEELGVKKDVWFVVKNKLISIIKSEIISPNSSDALFLYLAIKCSLDEIGSPISSGLLRSVLAQKKYGIRGNKLNFHFLNQLEKLKKAGLYKPTLYTPDIYLRSCLISYCDTLHLSPDVKQKATEIALKSTKLINTRKPSTIAVASIYIASISSEEKITQQKLSDTLGVDATSLRKTISDIITFFKIDMGGSD